MDGRERRSRPTGAAGLLHQGHAVQPPGQYPAVSNAGDRYQVQQPGTLSSGASAGRSSNMPSYSYGANAAGAYGDLSAGSAMQSASLQYPPSSTDYASSQEASRRAQQPAQHHGAQTSSQQPVQHPTQHQTPSHQSQTPYHSIYSQQGSPSSPYDPVQQYPPPRQSAAIEVLSNQFAGVTPAYYVAGEGGPTSAPNSGIAPQGVQPQYNPITYTTQSPVGRDSLASAYAAGMTDPSQAPAQQPAYGQQQPAYSQTAQTAELDNAFGQYQEALRRAFETIRDGNLAEAGTTVLSITEWLLGNAEVLGLVRDDESTHAERLKLWNEFNMCWLTLLQRQREITSESFESGQRPVPPRSLEYEQMENMGKELVRLCDSMEKHGLVDYEMGVWEEDIINLLTQCLEALDEQGAGPSSSRR